MPPHPPTDAETLALTALAAVMSEQRLAERFLSLTGLDPPELRQRAGEADMLAGLLRFLESHEPDLLLVAERIASDPESLVRARRELEG